MDCNSMTNNNQNKDQEHKVQLQLLQHPNQLLLNFVSSQNVIKNQQRAKRKAK